jgi:hypothetical protein
MVKRGKLVRVSKKGKRLPRRRRGEGDAQALLEILQRTKQLREAIRK